jgi:hypothetical protein
VHDPTHSRSLLTPSRTFFPIPVAPRVAPRVAYAFCTNQGRHSTPSRRNSCASPSLTPMATRLPSQPGHWQAIALRVAPRVAHAICTNHMLLSGPYPLSAFLSLTLARPDHVPSQAICITRCTTRCIRNLHQPHAAARSLCPSASLSLTLAAADCQAGSVAPHPPTDTHPPAHSVSLAAAQ